MDAPIVSFLTDYGLADAFVGICHGVIARACPRARVIDLTHQIAPHDVRAGALVLARALPYLPVGVHLAVVDPGVGGPRRAVAVACRDGQLLVGPDNGLLWPAVGASGGADAVVDIGDSPVALRPISATFHGRDVFAAVAGALAGGAAPGSLGVPVDPATLVALALPVARRDGDALLAHVVAIDHFGNLELDARVADLSGLGIAPGSRVAVRTGDRATTARFGRTFGDVATGELVLYEDPQAVLALAVNRDSAAVRLGVGVDAELRLAAS